MASAADTFQDRTLNKVALCSAVFAGFAYVGYSYARTAFSGRHRRRLEENEDPGGVSHVVLRRLSQTTQTETLSGNIRNSGKLFLKPKTVQERIKELNQRAQYFSDAFMAIQTGYDSSSAITRNRAMHAPQSVQCSPWHSPRVLSPVDVRHLVTSQSTENLTHYPTASPIKWKRRSLRRKGKDQQNTEDNESKQKLQKEAMELCRTQTTEQQEAIAKSRSKLLTPYEAKSLVSLLYSKDKPLIERTLVTIANCSAFSVNLDFLRESGCIHRLCDLLQEEEFRLPAVQTLGNVILSEENIRQAKDCLPHLMEFVTNSDPSNTGLRLASLIVLTNIATTSDWHQHFEQILDKLFELVDASGTHVQMQSLRLLVNLSCNKNMVPLLLSAEGPKRLCSLVSMATTDPVLLRILVLLNSLSCPVSSGEVSLENPSPQSMYSQLFDSTMAENLLDQAKQISANHRNPEIRNCTDKLIKNLQH